MIFLFLLLLYQIKSENWVSCSTLSFQHFNIFNTLFILLSLAFGTKKNDNKQHEQKIFVCHPKNDFFVSISYVSKSKKFVEFNQMWHIHTQFTNTMINTNFPSYRLAGSVMNMHIYTSTGNIVCFFSSLMTSIPLIAWGNKRRQQKKIIVHFI